MFKRLIFLIFLFFFLFPQKASAVTVVFTNHPSSISTEPFTIEISISKGAKAGTNYLRADLFKEGTKNYFGETYNGNSWYGESDGAQYFPVEIQSGATTSATFQARIGSPKASEFTGSGVYKLRVRRYTSPTNYNVEEANASSVPIEITTSTPTPTSTPSAPTPASSSTSTTKPSTPTPTPKATTVSVSMVREINSSKSFKDILGTESSKPSIKPTEKPQVKTLGTTENNLSKILIGLGVIILISGAGIFLKSFMNKSK